jgi:anti-sigma factor RsiW
MSRQPFETWLLAGEGLTDEQAERLHDHLQACPACQALLAAWAEAEGELRSSPWATPAPGFTARWQARLAAEQRRAQTRQVWVTLGLTVASALALVAMLAAGVVGSPGALLAAWLRTMAAWLADLRLVWHFAALLVGRLPPSVSWLSAIGLTSMLTALAVGLTAVWFVSIHRFAFQVHREGVTQ